jgi:hypothetical protein
MQIGAAAGGRYAEFQYFRAGFVQADSMSEETFRNAFSALEHGFANGRAMKSR